MDTNCSINCRRCLEDYSSAILAHTQSQVLLLVGLDECNGLSDNDAGDHGLRYQSPSVPGTDVIEETE